MPDDIQYRTFELTRTDSDGIHISLSSEHPVWRQEFRGYEVLDHSVNAVDMTRAARGLPLLLGHDPQEHIGRVSDIRLQARRLIGKLKFGSAQKAREAQSDVESRVLVDASIGYIVKRYVDAGEHDGAPVYRVTAWQPVEVSLVPIPADVTVGVNRSLETNMSDDILDSDSATIDGDDSATTLSRSERRAAARAAVAAEKAAAGATRRERERVAHIRELAGKFKRHIPETEVDSWVDGGLSFEDARLRMLALVEAGQAAMPTVNQGIYGGQVGQGPVGVRVESVPYSGKLTAFAGPRAEERAHMVGQYFRALAGVGEARRWVGDRYGTRALAEGVYTAGGSTVPAEIANEILTTTETFGIFRNEARLLTMNAASMSVPVADTGLTASFIGENSAISSQDNTWSAVTLSPKKAAILVRASNELLADSAVGIAQYIVSEAGRAFGELEDRCGFVGDGTSTYGGMRGILTILEDGSHGGSHALAGSGNDTLGEIGTGDLGRVVGLLPTRAMRGAKWFMSVTAFGETVERLMLSLGGMNSQDLAAGMPPRLLGHPVVLVPDDLLPSVVNQDYSGKLMVLFGNLKRASLFGLRREIGVQILTERYSEYDQLGFQLIERFDIAHADVGDGTDPGAIVGLLGN